MGRLQPRARRALRECQTPAVEMLKCCELHRVLVVCNEQGVPAGAAACSTVVSEGCARQGVQGGEAGWPFLLAAD